MCGENKAEAEFFYQNKQLHKLHKQCKKCYVEKRRKTWKEHYYKYGSKYRERAVARNRIIKGQTRAKLVEYLSNKYCVKCGIKDIRVLEFDHMDPSIKSFGISSAITGTYSWNKILQEIEKCQILCANCHKIKTALEQNWYKKLGQLA